VTVAADKSKMVMWILRLLQLVPVP
jgi:hypothetical protein